MFGNMGAKHRAMNKSFPVPAKARVVRPNGDTGICSQYEAQKLHEYDGTKVEILDDTVRENVNWLLERLPNTGTRQFRDFASDCPVYECDPSDWAKVQSGRNRNSGSIVAVCWNEETDEFFTFDWNLPDLYFPHADFVAQMEGQIKKGFVAYRDGARKNYRRFEQ